MSDLRCSAWRETAEAEEEERNGAEGNNILHEGADEGEM